MKILFLILLIVFGNAKDLSGHTERKLNGDAIIHQLFEMLKFYIRNGDELKGLPVLDPLKVDSGVAKISLPSKLLSLEANFTNGTVAGLGGFILEKANFIKDEIAVNLTIKYSSIIIKSDYYKIEGNFYEAVPITGEGIFDLEIKNFIFKGKVCMKQSEDGKSVLINNILKPEFSLQQITSNSEIDGTIDEIFNTLINELLAKYLTRFNKYLSQTYIPNIVGYLNPFFNKFDSWRLLAAVL